MLFRSPVTRSTVKEEADQDRKSVENVARPKDGAKNKVLARQESIQKKIIDEQKLVKTIKRVFTEKYEDLSKFITDPNSSVTGPEGPTKTNKKPKTAAEKIGVDPKTANVTKPSIDPAVKTPPTGSSGGSKPPSGGGSTGGGGGGSSPPGGSTPSSTPSPSSSRPSTWSKIKNSAFGQTTGKIARGAGTVLHYAAPAYGVYQMAKGGEAGEPTAVGPNFRPGGSWKPNKEWLNPTKDVAKSMSSSSAASLAAKTGSSALTKAARFIPGVSTAYGLGLAGYRALKGDYKGAGLAAASAVPGPVGWAATAADIGRDYIPGLKKTDKPEAVKTEPEKPAKPEQTKPETTTPTQKEPTKLPKMQDREQNIQGTRPSTTPAPTAPSTTPAAPKQEKVPTPPITPIKPVETPKAPVAPTPKASTAPSTTPAAPKPSDNPYEKMGANAPDASAASFFAADKEAQRRGMVKGPENPEEKESGPSKKKKIQESKIATIFKNNLNKKKKEEKESGSNPMIDFDPKLKRPGTDNTVY